MSLILQKTPRASFLRRTDQGLQFMKHAPVQFLAMTAKRRRWSSFRRRRLFPSCSRNTRFSSSR